LSVRFIGPVLALTMFALSFPACASPQSQSHPPAQARPPVQAQRPVLKADRVVVDKSERRMELLRDGRVIASYRVALGGNPKGPKIFEGDGRTPEGTYVLRGKNENSRFHRSIRISYPSPADRHRAWKYGGPPGGDIMIHGQPNGLAEPLQVPGDWTAGCIALTNARMREIWDHTPIGTPVEIRP